MATAKTPTITARRRFIVKLLTRAGRHKMKGDETAMMTEVADGFMRLGGVYVKFLQGVLLQLPAMRQWKNDKRFDVYEDVEPEPLDVKRLLLGTFPKDIVSKIHSINPTPFAAGSFGQVYLAKLIGGEQVVIKVLRPEARGALQKDLKLLKFVARLLGSSMSSFNLNLKALTSEFVASTMNEVDYKAEVKFALEFYEIHKNSPTIVVPKTYTELCSPNIITQEYIGGVSIAQILRNPNIEKTAEAYAAIVRETTGSDLHKQLSDLGTELYVSTLLGRPLHGDPHPGNIRLLPDNKVGLLDYGIRARPSVSSRAYYLMVKEWWRVEYAEEPDPGAVFVSYIRFYSERLYESMRVISEYASKRLGKPIKLDDYIAQLGNNYFRQKVSDQELKKSISDMREGKGAGSNSVVRVINADNRFGIVAKIKDGPLLRSLVTYNSLITVLGYRSIVPEVYERVIAYARTNMPELEYEPETTLALSEAIETLYEWLERIGNNDYELYRQITTHINGLTGTVKLDSK
ncbi:MAG: AarF/UbiB family protein [Patescibacteria group bacterium]